MKKVLAVIITVLMLASVMTISPFAGEVSGATVKIATAADLQKLGDADLLYKSFVLTADIDLSDVTWTIISNFNGILDGKGHKITGYTSNSPMFNTLGSTAVIRNITLENFTVSADKKVCALAYVNSGTVSGLTAKGLKVTAASTDASGLIYENKGRMENVDVEAEIVGSGDRAGGIVNCNRSGIIRYCTFKGSVTSNFHVGAIASNYYNDTKEGVIENCINYGTVTAWQSRAAGIAATCKNDAKIVNCINYGTIIALRKGNESNKVALTSGILGSESAGYTVQNCVNAGKLYTCKENNLIGGITGAAPKNSGSNIVNCYTVDGTVLNYNDDTYSNDKATAATLTEGSANVTHGFNTNISNMVANGQLVSAEVFASAEMVSKLGEAFTFDAGNSQYPIGLVPNTESSAQFAFAGVQNTVADSESGLQSIRFLGTVDSLNYKEIGFYIELDESTAEGTKMLRKTDRIVCTTVNAIGEDGNVCAVDASELGGEYIFALTINSVPTLKSGETDRTLTFRVTPVATDLDGNDVFGVCVTVTYVNGEFVSAKY